MPQVRQSTASHWPTGSNHFAQAVEIQIQRSITSGSRWVRALRYRHPHHTGNDNSRFIGYTHIVSRQGTRRPRVELMVFFISRVDLDHAKKRLATTTWPSMIRSAPQDSGTRFREACPSKSETNRYRQMDRGVFMDGTTLSCNTPMWRVVSETTAGSKTVASSLIYEMLDIPAAMQPGQPLLNPYPARAHYSFASSAFSQYIESETAPIKRCMSSL